MLKKAHTYLLPRQPGLWVALAALLADLFTKGLVLHLAARQVLPFWVVPPNWGFHLQWNTGMSFSLLQNTGWGPWLLAAVAVGASAWFIHWLGETHARLHQIGVGLILGGALGNLTDRLTHGAVVDFLVASPFGLFPYTFNVADACITVGVALLLLHGFQTRKVSS